MTMTGGIDLTLMIGPAVPVPVSKDILDALAGISVTSTSSRSPRSTTCLSSWAAPRFPWCA
jgi:hypothetical protein